MGKKEKTFGRLCLRTGSFLCYEHWGVWSWQRRVRGPNSRAWQDFCSSLPRKEERLFQGHCPGRANLPTRWKAVDAVFPFEAAPLCTGHEPSEQQDPDPIMVTPGAGALHCRQLAWATCGRWKCCSSCSWGSKFQWSRVDQQSPFHAMQETDKNKGSVKPSLHFSGFILVCEGKKMQEVLWSAGRSSVLSFGKPHWDISQCFLKFTQQMKPSWKCKGYQAFLQENFGNFCMYLWEEL